MTQPAHDAKPSRFKKYVTKLAQRQNLAMFEALKSSKPSMLRPRLTWGKLLAYLYAVLYYLIGLLIILVTAYSIIYSQFAICVSLVAVAVFLAAWLVRPRFCKFPEKCFTRADIPTLYAL